MKVLYFSWIKDKLGKSHEEIQVSDNIKTININFLKDIKMAWTKPMISEISVGLEINSYACAEK